MDIKYDISKLVEPRFIIPFIKDKKLVYITEPITIGTRIEPIPLDTCVSNFIENVGRNPKNIGNAKSQKFISDMETEFTDKETGFRHGMESLVYMPIEEDGEIKWRNVGGYHKNTAGRNVNANNLPGTKVKFSKNVAKEEKKLIIQQLQDSENENQIKSFQVEQSDIINSLDNYSKTWDNYPSIRNGLSKVDFLHHQMKTYLGITSNQTRRKRIHEVLGSNSPFLTVAHPLSGNSVVSEFVAKNYFGELEYDKVLGKIQFPQDQKFGSSKNTLPIELFSNSNIKFKPLLVKWDSMHRDYARVEHDMALAIENGSSYCSALFVTIDQLANSTDELNKRRNEVIEYLEMVISIFNKGAGSDRIILGGIILQGANESGGIITIKDYKQSIK